MGETTRGGTDDRRTDRTPRVFNTALSEMADRAGIVLQCGGAGAGSGGIAVILDLKKTFPHQLANGVLARAMPAGLSDALETTDQGLIADGQTYWFHSKLLLNTYNYTTPKHSVNNFSMNCLQFT